MESVKMVVLGILILVCFIFGGLYFYAENQIEDLENKIEVYKNNSDVLVTRLKKEHEDAVAVSREKSELAEEVKKDKSGFDWTADIAKSAPIIRLKRLHKNRGKVHTD